MKIVSIMPPDMDDGEYHGWSPCMLWCEQNCVGGWRYDTEGVFVFEHDADATLFLLRWA